MFEANSTWINDICNKDLSNRRIYAVLNKYNFDMILQLKYMPIVMHPARIASIEWLEILEMLWSVIRLIFKTSSVTPDFFYVFHLILSFSTCSQSFKKICTWELLGANVLKHVQKCLLVIAQNPASSKNNGPPLILVGRHTYPGMRLHCVCAVCFDFSFWHVTVFTVCPFAEFWQLSKRILVFSYKNGRGIYER